MKKLAQVVSVAILALLMPQLSAQNISFTEIQNKIVFGDRLGELGKGKQFTKSIPMLYTPDDIEIDTKNNFYICDKFSKKIIKYDSLLEFVFEISIPTENYNLNNSIKNNSKILDELYYHIDLETDSEGNLYALVTRQSFYYTIYKINKNGELLKDFHFDKQLINKRINGFRITNSKLYIYTFIEFNADIKEFQKNNSYVYTLKGEFLGQCDQYVEDYSGSLYKIIENGTITKYFPAIDSRILSTTELKVENKIRFNNSTKINLNFIDIDIQNKLYFINSYPFKIMVINSDGVVNDVGEENNLQEFLIDKYGILIPNVKQFLIAPNGEIYTYGFRTKSKSRDLFLKYTYDELELVFLKIRF